MKRIQIPALLAQAEASAGKGDRILLDGKVIYSGVGNLSGVYGETFNNAFSNQFKKWPRASVKVADGKWKVLEIRTYHNISRDRGVWALVGRYTLED